MGLVPTERLRVGVLTCHCLASACHCLGLTAPSMAHTKTNGWVGMGGSSHPLSLPRPAPSFRAQAKIPTSHDSREVYKHCNAKFALNQKSCGSCWAFSAATAFNWRLCVMSKGRFNEVISPQTITSCTLYPEGPARATTMPCGRRPPRCLLVPRACACRMAPSRHGVLSAGTHPCDRHVPRDIRLHEEEPRRLQRRVDGHCLRYDGERELGGERHGRRQVHGPCMHSPSWIPSPCARAFDSSLPSCLRNCCPVRIALARRCLWRKAALKFVHGSTATVYTWYVLLVARLAVVDGFALPPRRPRTPSRATRAP